MLYLGIGLIGLVALFAATIAIVGKRREAKAQRELSEQEPTVYRYKVERPSVRFTKDQHRAYIMLVVNSNLQVFNTFTGRALSYNERLEVLNEVSLDYLK